MVKNWASNAKSSIGLVLGRSRKYSTSYSQSRGRPWSICRHGSRMTGTLCDGVASWSDVLLSSKDIASCLRACESIRAKSSCGSLDCGGSARDYLHPSAPHLSEILKIKNRTAMAQRGLTQYTSLSVTVLGSPSLCLHIHQYRHIISSVTTSKRAIQQKAQIHPFVYL